MGREYVDIWRAVGWGVRAVFFGGVFSAENGRGCILGVARRLPPFETVVSSGVESPPLLCGVPRRRYRSVAQGGSTDRILSNRHGIRILVTSEGYEAQPVYLNL